MNALLQTEIRLPGGDPLVAKEIHLLKPAFIAALLLAVAPVWIIGQLGLIQGEGVRMVTLPLWCGALVLATSSFGREFGLNTFPLLLAQPWERSQASLF